MEAGFLKSLYVKNFLTYSECTLNFRSGLNIIYGANGTGKSSILAAILLAFGGAIKVLSRSKDLLDYIKYNEDTATIIVSMIFKDSEIVIKRIISRVNRIKSMWYINDSQKLEKDIIELRKKINIDFNNLCNFLPQDRVNDFFKMTPQNLLISFQETIDENLKKHHDKLINIVRIKKEKRTILQTNTKEHENLERKYELAHDEIKRYEDWKNNQRQIKLMELKLEWMKYEDGRIEVNKLKERHKEAQKALDRIRSSLIPDEEELKTSRSKITRLEKELHINKLKLNDLISNLNINKNNAELIIVDIKNHNANQQELQNQIIQGNKKIEGYKSTINSLTAECQNFQQEFANKSARVNEIDKEIYCYANKLDGINSEISEFENKAEQINGSIREIKQKLRLDSEKRSRVKEYIRRSDPDTYKAISWIENNKNVFRSKFHDPLAMQINLYDSRDAIFLQNHVARRDLYAFLSDNNDDVHTFISNIREKIGLRTSCILTSRESANLQTLNPNMFKNFKFRCFLRDIFECPVIPMAYLCETYNVHKIPIFYDLTDEEVEQLTKTKGISTFFTSKEKYMVKISQYTQLPSVSNFMLHDSEPIYMSVLTEKNVEKLLSDQLILENDLKKITDDLSKRKKSLLEIQENINKLKQEKKNISFINSKIKIIQSQIHSKTLELEQMIEHVKNFQKQIFDRSKLHKKQSNKLKTLMNNMCDTSKKVSAISSKIFDDHFVIFFNMSNLNKLNIKIKGYDSLLQSQNEQIQALKDEIDLKTKHNRILLEKAKALSGLKEKQKFSTDLVEELKRLPNDVSELHSKIAELELISSNSFCFDPNIVTKSKEIQTKISDIANSVDHLKKDISVLENEERGLLTTWLSKLNKLIYTISANFSSYFSQLNCIGRIELIKDPDDNYENYQLGIMVSYRKDEGVIQLNHQRHSGGEKAVAIVLFLLSIQQMSNSPFKMIDEINQGMDSSNEKTILDIMIKTTANLKSTNQYFFLSPKMLPDVSYDRHVTVHVIFNGNIKNKKARR